MAVRGGRGEESLMTAEAKEEGGEPWVAVNVASPVTGEGLETKCTHHGRQGTHQSRHTSQNLQ